MFEPDYQQNTGEENRPDPVLSPTVEAWRNVKDAYNEDVQPIDVEALNLGQRREQLQCLQQEVQELSKLVQPLFEEIATLAVSGQGALEEPSQHKDYVAQIRERIDALERLTVVLPVKKADIVRLEPKDCCLRASEEARKYCGECGTEMEEIGVVCVNCNTRNHENCNYCYNCRSDLKNNVPNVFQENNENEDSKTCHVCKEAINPDFPGSFCTKCGTRF